MKKNLLKIFSLLLALTLILGVAACDKGGETSKDPADSKTDTGEEITISFKNYFMGGDKAEAPAVAYHAMMEEFKANNKNVKFDEEILAHDAYEDKMMTLQASNELPDMFQLKEQWVKTFEANGLIGTMDDFLAADSAWKGGFVDGSFEEFTLNGKIYGIPFQFATVTNLFYNTEIFEECGITDFPETIDELIDAIKIFKDKGYIPITAGNDGGGWFLDVCFYRGILDRYAGPEWNAGIADDTAKFTDKEFVDALKMFKTIADLDAFNDDVNSIDYMEMRRHFYQGKAAMMFDGSGGILPFSQEAPEEILAVTDITIWPQLPGGKSTGTPGTFGWSLGYSSKVEGAKKQVVGEVLKALSGQKYAAIVAENNGLPAANPGDYNKSNLSDLMVKYNNVIETTNITSLANIQPAVLGVLYGGLQEVMLGQKTPEALAQELQDEQDSLD